MKLPRRDSKTWKPWIEIVKDGSVRQTIWDTPKDLRRVVAGALAVAKWHPDVLFDRGIGYCGWCDYIYVYSNLGCISCPLAKVDRACMSPESLYKKVMRYSGKKDKDKLYLVLYQIYAQEYREVFGE